VKIALMLMGLGLGLTALVVIVGYMLPVNHVATHSTTLGAPVDRVWAAISDFKGSADWRDLKAVEQVEVRPGVFAWKEVAKNGDAITYLTIEATPGKKLVRKISDEGLPFGGSWTFELVQEKASTVLTITERGEVYNPIFRFVSRFVFGHQASIDKYLAQLKKHLERV